MNLADEPFGDGCAFVQIAADEVEGALVVEELARVVGVGRRNFSALQEPSGIVEREARAFDVRRVVSFEQEGSRAHRRDPVLGQGGGFQEAARSFGPRER